MKLEFQTFSLASTWTSVVFLILLSNVQTTCATLTTQAAPIKGNTITSVEKRVVNEFWTEWFNTDTPRHGAGDLETPSLIAQRLGRGVCPLGIPIGAECRLLEYAILFTGQSPENQLTTLCSRHGLECYNEEQNSKICFDYAIRFKCRSISGESPEPDIDDNDSEETTASQFDGRVYILLTIVPICIFVIRLIWSWFFRKRHQTQESRTHRASIIADAEDETLSSPPPSYDELFHNQPAPYIISGSSMTLPHICRNCQNARCSKSRQGPVRSNREENLDSGNTVQVNDIHVIQEYGMSNAALSSTSENMGENEVFSDENTTQEVTALGQQNSTECTCSCHHYAYNNFSYVENEQVISNNTQHRLPGMHMPVFGRNFSTSSLPNYEEALKILEENPKENPAKTQF